MSDVPLFDPASHDAEGFAAALQASLDALDASVELEEVCRAVVDQGWIEAGLRSQLGALKDRVERLAAELAALTVPAPEGDGKVRAALCSDFAGVAALLLVIDHLFGGLSEDDRGVLFCLLHHYDWEQGHGSAH